MQKHLNLGYSKMGYVPNSIAVSKCAKIKNRYNQVPHLTQDTNGKVTNAQLDTTNESQEVSPFPAGFYLRVRNRKIIPLHMLNIMLKKIFKILR